MRDPHFRRKSETQRRKQRSRGAGGDEIGPPRRPVEREGRGKREQGRRKQTQAIDEDACRRRARHSHDDLPRRQRQCVGGEARGDVVPMEGPDFPRRHRIGEDRAVAVGLELEDKPYQDEQQRGRTASGNDKPAQQARAVVVALIGKSHSQGIAKKPPATKRTAQFRVSGSDAPDCSPRWRTSSSRRK